MINQYRKCRFLFSWRNGYEGIQYNCGVYTIEALHKAEGEKQIKEYLDFFGLNTGYMLSFYFNKNKETGVKQEQIGDKVLIEGMV